MAKNGGAVLKSAQDVREQAAASAEIEVDLVLQAYARQHTHCIIDRRDSGPDRSKPWHLIAGPGPRCGGELAEFATREQAIAFARAHGISALVPSLGNASI